MNAPRKTPRPISPERRARIDRYAAALVRDAREGTRTAAAAEQRSWGR